MTSCSIVMCVSLRNWLESMVRHVEANPGCRLVRSDHPRHRILAMSDPEAPVEFTLGLSDAANRPNWGIRPPQGFVDLLKTQESRDKLAHVLSVGDHCLDFGDPR